MPIAAAAPAHPPPWDMLTSPRATEPWTNRSSPDPCAPARADARKKSPRNERASPTAALLPDPSEIEPRPAATGRRPADTICL